jgi:hypothetical protein
MAAAGRLPRNIVAGIRTPATMRSDEAWYAGHRAAASALTIAGAGPIAVGAYAATRARGRAVSPLAFKIGTMWLLGWLAAATVQASRAARATVAS